MRINSPQRNFEFLKTYWREANELYFQALNSSSSKIAEPAVKKLAACKELGSLFLRQMMEEQEVSSKDEAETLKKLGVEADIGTIPIDFMLGFAIKAQMNKNETIKAIKNSIGKLGSLSLEDSDSDEEVRRSNFSAIERSLATTNPRSEDTFCMEGANFDDDDTSDLSLVLNNDAAVQERSDVQEYLNKLSQAATQLSYLCQHMKWSQPCFTEGKSDISPALFKAHSEVIVRVKHGLTKTVEGECQAAPSKKEARRVASLFILKQIYNTWPQVWVKFRKLCSEDNKGMEQPLTANNEQIFKKAKVNEIISFEMFKEEVQKGELTGLDRQISEYLNSLASFKNELNLLQGKYKKIRQPEFKAEKQDQYGLWPVFAQIQDEGQILTTMQRESSKKKSEEMCSRELLMQIYRRDPARWSEFLAYKRSKNM